MASAPASTTAPDAARARLVEAIVATGGEDRAAFQRLYRLTRAKLFGICLRICGTREAAEDVLQDVYLIIWRRAGGYEPGRASPITWLATIARNRAIDWRRANPVRAAAGVEEAADVADARPDAAAGMLDAEEGRRLHLCLDQLEPPQRETIRTAFFGGVTYAELADRRGVPLGTMKSWIRRGLLRLRDCLRDDA
ncbi:sigma-70 family RNA polymerase sigma factor [Sphingomonas lenta]|uniref:RNA polymerase sigma factor n=1 Tax=Sphingomonas lenta TaxID=1141887 RepID=A0A2A2SC26_9SPHN|nr:sigma-70 family RNA polymerase sigma factor [Sphingomonas lenta]PAX06854.1 RNA polymerase subunit sigma [Sphingomonas lenta]